MPAKITIIGLGPGGAGMLTVEAREALAAAREVWVRTARHPAVEELPDLAWRPMNFLLRDAGRFLGRVYGDCGQVLRLAERPQGVSTPCRATRWWARPR